MEHNLNNRIIDATELAEPVEPILGNRMTRSGIPLWASHDLVHLRPEAYPELADALLEGDPD
jgi:hypothetical protein